MDFDQLVWKPHPIGEGWDDVTPDPVIWTAVNLLDRAWHSAEDYVGPSGVGSNQAGKYERVGTFLRQYGVVVLSVQNLALRFENAIITNDLTILVCSAVADSRRLAASGSARCYRQILHGKDDYPTEREADEWERLVEKWIGSHER
ncbi:hypothetical protein [Paraburkholderia hospita]|uniref:hypothetical protein n=1 Tax=Paraburkholderia hospita TaxID=169430 RepID=UPI000271B669|nr:hypothetical protein [Paraburkholderia hospita]EUC12353.1 hypothetical protein PMI06_008736 [Burkholderia sp. BT03]SKC51985.1 hypothetical protein SAMN06266956_0477 [Paraburkholderia hospita]